MILSEKTLASFCSRIILSGFTHHYPSSCPSVLCSFDWVHCIEFIDWLRVVGQEQKSGFPCNPSFQWAFYLLRLARHFSVRLELLMGTGLFFYFLKLVYIYTCIRKLLFVCLAQCQALKRQLINIFEWVNKNHPCSVYRDYTPILSS